MNQDSIMYCRRFFAGVVITALIAGCNAGMDADSSDAVVRDSSGVTIAQNMGRLELDKMVWTVAGQPEFTIGSVDGDPAYQFSRITAMARLNDGGIVIAHRDPLELRVFDSTGKFVKTLGRAGQGPGEFGSLDELFVLGGDTIIASDSRYQRRINRFSITGGYIDVTLPDNAAITAAFPDSMQPAEGQRGLLSNGSMILSGWRGEYVNYDDTPLGQAFRPTTEVFWMSEDLSRTTELGKFGDLEQIFIESASGRSVMFPIAMRMSLSEQSALHPSHHCITENSIPEVHCVDANGAHRIIRWAHEPTRISTEEIEEWKRSVRVPGISANDAERQIAAGLINETYPPITRMVVADDGSVLVASPDLVGSSDSSRRYRVFNASGLLTGVTEFPANFRIMNIRDDRVAGTIADENGVASIVSYRIIRSG